MFSLSFFMHFRKIDGKIEKQNMLHNDWKRVKIIISNLFEESSYKSMENRFLKIDF